MSFRTKAGFGALATLVVALGIGLVVSLASASEGDQGAGAPNQGEVPAAPAAGDEMAAPPAPAESEEFRDCLEENGAEPPEPPSDPADGPPSPKDGPTAKERKAFEACADLLPEGAGPGMAPGGGPGVPCGPPPGAPAPTQPEGDEAPNSSE